MDYTKRKVDYKYCQYSWEVQDFIQKQQDIEIISICVKDGNFVIFYSIPQT